MDLKSLFGKRSLTAKQLVLNPDYPTGTLLGARAGNTTLGVHHRLEVGLEIESGRAAWHEWLRSIYDSLMLMHANAPAATYYTMGDLAKYLEFCWFNHIAFCEAQRDVAMITWEWPSDFKALYDYWGPTAGAAAEVNRGQKTTYANQINGLADSFYTAYPFPIPNFIATVAELVSKVWRDDSSRRTNFHYFHMMFTPWTENSTHFFSQYWSYLGQNQTYLLNNLGTYFSNASALTYIVGDIRQVFGTQANQSLPLLTGREIPVIDYSVDLIRALNQSPYGLPDYLGTSSFVSSTYQYSLANLASLQDVKPSFGGWFSDPNRDPENNGPEFVTEQRGSWSSALSPNWNALFADMPSLQIPMYDAFSGDDVLMDMSFYSIPYCYTSSGGTVDLSPDFTHPSGSCILGIRGLFGFTIAETFFFHIMNADGNFNANPTPVMTTSYVWVSGTALSAGGGPRFAPLGMPYYVVHLADTLGVSASVDGITPWQFQDWIGYGYFSISDEDIDEWSLLERSRLLATYASTAKSMFMSDGVVPSRSNKVADASLASERSGLDVNSRSGSGSYKSGRGGRDNGKKKWNRTPRK